MREMIYLLICFFAFLFERNFINFVRDVPCHIEEEEGLEDSDLEDLEEDLEGLEESIEEEDCDNNKKEEI